MIRRILLIGFVIVSLLAGLVWSVSGQEETIHQAAFVSRDDLALTVYGEMTVVVQDTRTFQLEAGLNWVNFEGYSQDLRQDSVTLTSTADLFVSEFSYALPSQSTSDPLPSVSSVLLASTGQAVRITLIDGTAYEGVIQSVVSGAVTLTLSDGAFVRILETEIRQVALSEQPEATPTEEAPNPAQMAITQPTLRFLVSSAEAGEFPITLTYTTIGLNWGFYYNLVLSDDATGLDVSGWLALTNNLGMRLENARVTLASPGFDRLQFVSRDVDTAAFALTATAPASPYPMPETGGGGGGLPSIEQPDDFFYPIPQPLTLDVYETRRVEFLGDAEANTRNVYVYDASPRIFGYSGFITNPTYGVTDVTQVQNFLEFSTATEGGLGTALPAGMMLIYQAGGEEGAPRLLGETVLAYTPLGERVQIYLENTFTLTGERRQTGFQLLSEDSLQETYEIRLFNLGDEAVEVLVPERMTRSASWEILASSAPYEQPDAFGVEFVVDVPAGGETIITYTVLYTRAE